MVSGMKTKCWIMLLLLAFASSCFSDAVPVIERDCHEASFRPSVKAELGNVCFSELLAGSLLDVDIQTTKDFLATRLASEGNNPIIIVAENMRNNNSMDTRSVEVVVDMQFYLWEAVMKVLKSAETLEGNKVFSTGIIDIVNYAFCIGEFSCILQNTRLPGMTREYRTRPIPIAERSNSAISISSFFHRGSISGGMLICSNTF